MYHISLLSQAKIQSQYSTNIQAKDYFAAIIEFIMSIDFKFELY
jgi:hypothetical protein